jgi:hypothetical protein
MNWRADELAEYVRVSFAAGATEPEIAATLRASGWAEEQIATALHSPALPDPVAPAPKSRPAGNGWEGLLYLVLIASLFVSTFSLADLIFSLLEIHIVEPIAYYSNLDRAIQWAVARLVIALPVFLFAAHRVGRMLARDPAKRNSPVRRWAIYIAMFIALVALVGDAATLVAYAMRGEIYLRFLLKVATVAVIAGAVFACYMRALGRGAEARQSAGRLPVAILVLACAGAIAAGMTIVGPPWSYRAIEQDYRRSANLEAIEIGIWGYHDDYGRLPETLDAIDSLWHDELYDPETGELYEYRIIGDTSYELCATFARAMAEGDPDWVTDFSTHAAGRHCFEREVR